MVSSSARFIDAALRATGEGALPFLHQPQSEMGNPAAPPRPPRRLPCPLARSDTFTDDDGTASHLLHAHGFLPISSSTRHVLVTIWLH
ncbi:hypothetical protein BHE74_00058764 [Ensete ventricosum]|nr:hypothetical protein BHE74_00058764 [Ensete ventricosum]